MELKWERMKHLFGCIGLSCITWDLCCSVDFPSCCTQTQLLCDMWDHSSLTGSRTHPPALEGRFSTSRPPEKFQNETFLRNTEESDVTRAQGTRRRSVREKTERLTSGHVMKAFTTLQTLSYPVGRREQYQLSTLKLRPRLMLMPTTLAMPTNTKGESFSCGSEVKNPPPNSGDVGSIPG